MTPFCKTLTLIFVLLAVLLVAGCAEQAEGGKSVGNVPSTVLITTSIPAPTQTEIYQVPPDGYWIKIDPISDKYVGEIFMITSTTNLPTGEEILVQIYTSTFFPGPKMQTREFSGATGTVRVVKGMNGINAISFVVDSSTLYNSSPLKPEEYFVTEDAVIQPVTGTALFNVLPAPDSYGKPPLKPKNFIDWEKLDLPQLKINYSMQPEIPKFAMNFNTDSQYRELFYYGSIVVFSQDGIVRFFDKSGTQIAAYYDFGTLHSSALSSGVMTSTPVGNVTIFTYHGERLLTLIFEAGN